MGLGLRPISRHRQSLFQAAASRWWAKGRRWSCCGRHGPCECGCRPRPRQRPWLGAAWLRRLAGQGASVANGSACRPAVAAPNTVVIPSNHFRIAVGVPGKVPGRFQGKRDFHAVAETLVVFPAAARISLLSAVPIQEGHQQYCAADGQLHNSSSVVPRPEQPGGGNTPADRDRRRAPRIPRDQIQGLPAESSVQYADKTLLIPAAMASQSSGAHH